MHEIKQLSRYGYQYIVHIRNISIAQLAILLSMLINDDYYGECSVFHILCTLLVFPVCFLTIACTGLRECAQSRQKSRWKQCYDLMYSSSNYLRDGRCKHKLGTNIKVLKQRRALTDNVYVDRVVKQNAITANKTQACNSVANNNRRSLTL